MTASFISGKADFRTKKSYRRQRGALRNDEGVDSP